MTVSARSRDENGFVEIKDNPISKVGVFPYLGRSISADLEPDQVYNVFRPEEELADPECLDSFKLLPWIDEHEMLGDGFTPAEEKGMHGVIGESVRYEGGLLLANLKIFSKSLAALIESGKKALSIGYRCLFENSSGAWNGINYDFVQRQLRGNHIALVDVGRAGPDIAVLDGYAMDHAVFTFDEKEHGMAEETENKGMTLEEVTNCLKEIMPQVKALNEAMASHKDATVLDEDDDKEKVKRDEDKASDEDDMDEEAMDEKDDKEDEKEKDKSAMDSAIKSLQKKIKALESGISKNTLVELAQRDRLANRVSYFTGAFDHSEMTTEQVAEYALKKLGLTAKGNPQDVLYGYLHNRAAPSEEITYGMDAAASTGSEIDAFLSGK